MKLSQSSVYELTICREKISHPGLLTSVRNNATVLIMPKKKRRPTSDAVEILHRRYYEVKPERLAGLERARADNQVAREIVALRTRAGLSQRQLAQLVGTTASVI